MMGVEISLNLVDEWNNFMERIECKKDSEVWETEENILQLRHWASLRGQTLCRTGISSEAYDCYPLVNISLLVFINFDLMQLGEWCTTDGLWNSRLFWTWLTKKVKVKFFFLVLKYFSSCGVCLTKPFWIPRVYMTCMLITGRLKMRGYPPNWLLFFP